MDYKEAIEVENILNSLPAHSDENAEDIARLKEIFTPMIENEKKKQFKQERRIKQSWGNLHPETVIAQTIANLTMIKSLYNEAYAEVGTYDKETQDLLHAMELIDPDSPEWTEVLGDPLADIIAIRKERRKAKDFMELTQDLYDITQTLEAKFVVDKLREAHTDAVKNRQRQANRKYTPRVRTAFEEAFNKADKTNEKIDNITI